VDTFLEDESAVLALAQIRSFDVKLFHHSLNACVYAILIGQRLGLSRRQLAELGLAALFHDVGMTAPRGGTEQEEERAHPSRGARMLLEEATSHEGMLKAAIAAFEHHTGVDRSGFPAIDHDPHLVSRIVAVADAYDALTASPGPTPVGSLVELTTGETAIVAGPPAVPDALDRPRVRIVKRGSGTLEADAVVDLAASPRGSRVARAMPAGAVFPSVLDHVSAL
jgi:hypothetical protein